MCVVCIKAISHSTWFVDLFVNGALLEVTWTKKEAKLLQHFNLNLGIGVIKIKQSINS